MHIIDTRQVPGYMLMRALKTNWALMFTLLMAPKLCTVVSQNNALWTTRNLISKYTLMNIKIVNIEFKGNISTVKAWSSSLDTLDTYIGSAAAVVNGIGWMAQTISSVISLTKSFQSVTSFQLLNP
jgi:hypothetical protein